MASPGQLDLAPPNNPQNWSLQLKLAGRLLWVFIYQFYYCILFVYNSIFPGQNPRLQDNEVILVTGGASGIGREICLYLASLNKNVTIISWDVNEKANGLILKELKGRGVQKVHGFKVDVSNQEEVERTAQKIREEIGHVTILVNNAGIVGEVGYAWEMSPESVQKVYDINVVSHCWTLRAFLPAMIERGSGHVVETCSVAGFLTGGFVAPYIASKHALFGYIQCVKEDLRRHPKKPKVHFTLLYPSVTQTPLVHALDYKVAYSSSVVPDMSPRYVATRAIDGMLRNEEHVYAPPSFRFVATLYSLFPTPVLRKIIDILDIDLVVKK